MITRRWVLGGLIAAPAIIPINNLMRVKNIDLWKIDFPEIEPVRNYHIGKGVLSIHDGVNWVEIGEVSDFRMEPIENEKRIRGNDDVFAQRNSTPGEEARRYISIRL